MLLDSPADEMRVEPAQITFPPTVDIVDVSEPPLPAWATRKLPHGCG